MMASQAKMSSSRPQVSSHRARFVSRLFIVGIGLRTGHN
jgi:hypothetical protein